MTKKIIKEGSLVSSVDEVLDNLSEAKNNLEMITVSPSDEERKETLLMLIDRLSDEISKLR